MSEVIREYYSKTKLEEFQLKHKLEMLERHMDIQKELEYWIINRKYLQDGICVEGYSAETLSKVSKYLDGESAFIMLIKLRENPEDAKNQIEKGFKIK